MKKQIVLVAALAMFVIACSSGGSTSSTPVAEPTAKRSPVASLTSTPAVIATSTPVSAATGAASVANGATVALTDGTRLVVPPGAVTTDIPVSLDQTGVPPTSPGEGATLGHAVNVNLQGQTLNQPATLELPYDPSKLPADVAEDEIFAAYYDDTTGTWIPVGGTADPARHVIVVQIMHASWWEPFSWITDALLQGIVAGFKFDIGHVVNAFTAFEGCVDSPQGVIIDEGENYDYLGSCVEHDDTLHPTLRIINRRVVELNVKPVPGPATSDLGAIDGMGPLERQSFSVDFSNAPVSEPFVVQAEVDITNTVVDGILDFILAFPGTDKTFFAGTRGKIAKILLDNRDFIEALQDAQAGDGGGFSAKLRQALGSKVTNDAIADAIMSALPKGSPIRALGPILRSNLWAAFWGAGLGIQLADGVIQAQFGAGFVKFYSNRPIRPDTPAANVYATEVLALKAQLDASLDADSARSPAHEPGNRKVKSEALLTCTEAHNRYPPSDSFHFCYKFLERRGDIGLWLVGSLYSEGAYVFLRQVTGGFAVIDFDACAGYSNPEECVPAWPQ